MNSAISAIHTNKAPAAIGPYSQAIRVGKMLFTSGQVALDPQTGAMSTGNVEEQTRQVLSNLRAILHAAGLDFNNVVKTTVFLKNMAEFPVVNTIYGEAFAAENTVPPARSTVEVARLPREALVEIEAIAVFPDAE